MPLDFLNKIKRPSISASSMVSITDNVGRKAADSDTEIGDPFTILSVLNDHSPMSVSGLARECRIDVFRTAKVVEKLRNQGKVSVNEYSES